MKLSFALSTILLLLPALVSAARETDGRSLKEVNFMPRRNHFARRSRNLLNRQTAAQKATQAQQEQAVQAERAKAQAADKANQAQDKANQQKAADANTQKAKQQNGGAQQNKQNQNAAATTAAAATKTAAAATANKNANANANKNAAATADKNANKNANATANKNANATANKNATATATVDKNANKNATATADKNANKNVDKNANANSTASVDTSSTTAAAAASASVAATATDNSPDKSLTLLSTLVATGSAQDGQSGTVEAGQVRSLTSTNNFINYCAGKTITNGLQVTAGSCNPIPMGDIIAQANMPACKFKFPTNFSTIPANVTFTAQLAVQNMKTGTFTNAQKTYYAAPQQIDATTNNIISHSHIVIQPMGDFKDPAILDPLKFDFFKGLNDAAVDGVLSAVVDKGLSPGNYRMASINTNGNHAPAVGAVAQHGFFDDIVYFTAK